MKTPFLATLLAVLFVPPLLCPSQQPPPPPPPPASTPAENNPPPQQAETGSSSSKSKTKLIPSYLIVGTVFNENSLSFPGAEVLIRKSGEKKVRWNTATNSRGEFAMRVPPGFEYVVTVKAKKYEDKTEQVDAKVDVQQRLSIKLVPKNHEKTGAKP
jgi:Carboxypeptidase regulatory-like domain